MKKVLSRILSAPIQNKVLRYRVRGIIAYGPLKALKLRRKARRNNTPQQYKLTLCAAAKNEAPYLAEWIEYHKMMGVERFYIYDNESDDNTKEVLQAYIDSGLVEYRFMPGKKMQLAIYEDCLERHRFDSQWIAFIDIDEFIVPFKHTTITDFLKEYEDFSAVQINWLCYGSAGQRERTPGLVIERFRDHAAEDDPQNRRVKSIVQPARVVNFSGAHECVRLTGKTVDPHKKTVNKICKELPPAGLDIIRVNHYAVKSYEEFQAKKARGRARFAGVRDDSYFTNFDLNDVKDDPAMDKYVALVKEKLGEKTD
ncbi:glycosyltransferase family 92 protein [Alistipes sp. OttesenSCG-928-B03]|nr:glycosyltransferase family 92 protein [Alistipes sp. OttesenSCG-928-B03]